MASSEQVHEKLGDNPEFIKIRNVRGGKVRDNNDLKTCAFYPSANHGHYLLYTDKDSPGSYRFVHGNILSGSSFSFDLDNRRWTIGNPNDSTAFVVNDEVAGGTWSNALLTKKDDDDEEGDESGTFQAQSGGQGQPVGLKGTVSSAKA